MVYKNVREENNENIFLGIYAEQAEHWNFSIRSSKKSYQNKVTEFGVGYGKYHMSRKSTNSRILSRFPNPPPILESFSPNFQIIFQNPFLISVSLFSAERTETTKVGIINHIFNLTQNMRLCVLVCVCVRV